MKRLFFLLIFFGLSVAQNEDELMLMSLEDILNMEVVTVSKKAQKSSDAPATIYVVPDQTINNRGYRNLMELLEDIPEIEIQKKSVAELNQYYTFRGISGNEKFVILLDGFRVNSITGSPHAVGMNYPLDNAKRVEVILGPASALYGVDAFSGIINIITKDGKDINGGSLTGSLGSFSTTDNGFVYGRQIDDVSFTLAASYYLSGEPEFPDFYKSEYDWYINEYKKYNKVRLAPFAPDVPYFPEDSIQPYETPTEAYSVHGKLKFSDFTFSYLQNFESHNTSVGGKPDYNIYRKDAVYDVTITSWSAKHDYSNESNTLNIQSSISHGTYLLGNSSKFVNTFTNYNNGFKYASDKSTKIEEQFTLFLDDDNTIIFGVSYEDISSLPKTGDLPVKFDPKKATASQGLYYFGTNVKDKNGNDLTIFQDFLNVEYQNFGSYFQYQGKPIMDELEITAGLRYDDNTRYGDTFNPRIGLVFTPMEKTKVKALWGSAFLAPSTYKAYQHYGAFVPVDADGNITFNSPDITGLFGPFWHLPNPDLKPEELNSLEGSISTYLTDNIAVSASGYLTNIENLIITETTLNQSFHGVFVAAAERPINKGKAEIFGGSLKVDAFIPFGEYTLNSYFVYSYVDGDIEGDKLPYAAQSTFKIGTEFYNNKLSVSPRIVYRTKSYHALMKDDAGNQFSNDDYWVLNLYMKYKLLDNVSAFLRVDNVLDERYYNVPFATAEFFTKTPQDPRRILFGVNFKF